MTDVNTLDVTKTINSTTHQAPELEQVQAEDFFLAHYVRLGKRFCHIKRPNEPLSEEELLQSALTLLRATHKQHKVTARVLRGALNTVTDLDGDDPKRLVPVWGGSSVSVPGTAERVIATDTGTVLLNLWAKPSYREVAEPSNDLAVFLEFFRTVLPARAQRVLVLDWLAWGLQNEGDRPNWGVMLYSEQKGTGKSTFALICRALFGGENSLVLNGVGQLTQKFNGSALLSKFVNCEEVDIPAKGNQANRLKTLFTDDGAVLEAKGKEMERALLISNFLFTSNHVPHFLSELDRRLYVVDVSHDGHASGSQAQEFAALTERVRVALEDERRVAGLYQHLMRRPLSAGFNPKSLNTALQSTPIMTRILDSGEAQTQQLREHLDGHDVNAITLATLNTYCQRSMRLRPEMTRGLMLQLGWSQRKAKWGGANYSQSIWVRPEWVVSRGQLIGPEGSKEGLGAHLNKLLEV